MGVEELDFSRHNSSMELAEVKKVNDFFLTKI